MQDDFYYDKDIIKMQNLRGQMRMYKLAEIINETQVHILLYFLLPEYKTQYKISDNLRYMIDMETYDLYERDVYYFSNNIFIWKQLTTNLNETNNWKYNLNNSIVSSSLKYYVEYEIKSKSY